MKDLSELNLNLLLALEALLTEVNVTRAAGRMGVSQPAMSRSLQKLREHLGDELLVRNGRGLVRTPRAEAIHGSLRHGLLTLRRALAEEGDFVPGRSTRTFTIAANDVMGVWLLPALAARVREQAPGVSLSVVPLESPDFAAQLDAGALDLTLGVDLVDAAGLKRRRLFRDGWICLVRGDHPRVGEALDLKEYASLPHALCSPRGEGSGVVDQALAAAGLTRQITFRTRYFIVAAITVSVSDMVLTMPRRSGLSLATKLGLRALDPPLDLPSLDVMALWHERMDELPAHRWLRQTVFSLI